jgi:hydantoinase/carbamoylase family amidase
MQDWYRDFEVLWRELQGFNDAEMGTTRVAFTETDQRSRQWLKREWEKRGLVTQMDGVGNLIGRVGDPPYVLLSSHTDTVPNGGSYDGILGVLAATVIAARWDTAQGGLMVIDWSSEESSRFGISTLGSRLAVGESDPSYFETRDRQGVRLADAIRVSYGYPVVPLLRLQDYAIKAALELHMEQGDELKAAKSPLAIVTAIAAPQRWRVTIEGEANHSGATAMARRADALAAFAEFVLFVEQQSRALEHQGLRSTVTEVVVHPGAANVVAGLASGIVDVRAQSQSLLAQYRARLQTAGDTLGSRRRVTVRLEEISGEKPGGLDPGVMTIMRQVFTQRGLPPLEIPSWPSHDSLPLSRHLPVGMLFVRNPSGVSHNVQEDLNSEDIALAIAVFDEIVKRASGGS